MKNKSALDLTKAINVLNEEPHSADISLVCGEKQLSCHKSILAARSDVFAAMFSHSETTEAASKEVKIDDTDPDTLEIFLRWVVTFLGTWQLNLELYTLLQIHIWCECQRHQF